MQVYLGNGDGTFRVGATTSAFASKAVAAGDLNGDGKADLVLVSPTSVGVLLGNGNGTFKPVTYLRCSMQAPPG